MIEDPVVRPDIIGGLEQDFGTSIASSIWLKIINNHAWVQKNIPIGFLLNLHRDIQPVTGPALSDPNSDIWIFCDGSLINDADSPLDGQNVPDMRNRFLKHSSTSEFLLGGNSTTSLLHTHVIGQVDDRQPDFQADNQTERVSGVLHDHPVTNDLSAAENIIPLHILYHVYMRFK